MFKSIKFQLHTAVDPSAIEALFIDAFTHSEGESEGRLIGDLVKNLLVKTEKGDLYGFVAADPERLAGAILFSRLTFQEPVNAFILSPVAVHPDFQRLGIGQALIKYGLAQLANQGVRIVTTYGDPEFYAKAGFASLSPEFIAPPLQLSQPEGWLGQSLNGESIKPIAGRCTCVQALDNPVYW